MPGLSKVIVLDPDVRAGRQIQLGFEREGLAVATIPADPAKLDLPGEDTGLVMIGGGLELVRRTRAQLLERRIDVPIVFAGRGVEREAARAAGADEVVAQPAYLRDVVTIGRLLCGVPTSGRQHLVGSLVEVTGVFTLVRAFAALGRSATLTLVRGLRRGEIRFWNGEVTSAQVGMIHGQAALHQLLLWTDARFDFRHEDVVRRQQIPMSHDELFADAERFLEGVRESSGGLSPSIVLEQDLPRVQSFGKQIPTEVYGVLRMFDGYRVLADVLEDSAYRVFETLRVAQRAVEIGLLRVIDKQPVRARWRTILSLEEWLVGSEAREAPIDSGPVAAPGASGPIRESKSKARRKRKKKTKRIDTPVVIAGVPKEIDWGALVPRTVGAEVGPLAGVVPAAQASGEIAERASTAGGGASPRRSEPSIVFDEAARVLAHTVTTSTEPARVADDLQAADTKPERVGNRTTLQGVAVVAEAVVAATPEAVASGAITVPMAVPVVAEVSGATTTKIAVVPPPAAPVGSAPDVIVDEPSDGVIIQHIATAQTAPVKRRRAPSHPPEDDRPGDVTGEIGPPRPRSTPDPRRSEPSILVADLAAIHSAVSAIAGAQAAAPATTDATSAAHEAPVLAARSDAVAFSEVEEAFFRAGHEKEAQVAAPPTVESFEDLDEGYRPLGFWARLRGKARRAPPPSNAAPSKAAPAKAVIPTPTSAASAPGASKPTAPHKSAPHKSAHGKPKKR